MNKIKLLSLAIFLAGCGEAAEPGNSHVHYELPEWEPLNERKIRNSGDTSTGVSTYDWGGGQ